MKALVGNRRGMPNINATMERLGDVWYRKLRWCNAATSDVKVPGVAYACVKVVYACVKVV